jgi:hypothetical protein
MAQGPNPTGTPTPARRRKRIPQEHYDTVATMLISMVPYTEIQKQLSMRWAKPRKYILDIISQVHTDWQAEAAATMGTRRNQIRQGFEALYMKALKENKLVVAAMVMKELGKLDGAYATEELAVQHHHSGVVGQVGISLGGLGFKSPDEVRARIEALRAQLASAGPQVLAPAAQAVNVGHSQLTGAPLPNHTNLVIDVSSDDSD